MLRFFFCTVMTMMNASKKHLRTHTHTVNDDGPLLHAGSAASETTTRGAHHRVVLSPYDDALDKTIFRNPERCDGGAVQ